MTIFLLMSLGLTAVAVALLARALVMPRMRASQTVARIDAYGFAKRREEEDGSRGAVRSTLDEIAGLVGAAIAGRFSDLRETELRRELMAAGLYSFAPRKFVGYRVICAGSAGFVWGWLWAIGTVGPFLGLFGIPAAVLAGWACPRIILRKRAERRWGEIDYELPELIDLLVVTVEAGLGFNSSLRVASDRLEGPLGDELRLALQEQSMGLSTNESLRNMQARCGTASIRSFVRSILQGETLGISIGQILRNLAVEMRKRRRADAQERAQKAPIKILFPLIFMIFPAMFVIVLGPAIIALMKGLG